METSLEMTSKKKQKPTKKKKHACCYMHRLMCIYVYLEKLIQGTHLKVIW